jgi:hypothetical protein
MEADKAVIQETAQLILPQVKRGATESNERLLKEKASGRRRRSLIWRE